MIRQLLLGLGVFLIVGGFVLVWDSPPEAFLRDNLREVEEIPEADSYMTDVTSQRFTQQGEMQLSIVSPRLEFFKEPSRALVTTPQILTRTASGDPFEIDAQTAILTDGEQTLVLEGDVTATSRGVDRQQILRSQYLEFHLQQNQVHTDHEFELQTPRAKVTGKGLRIELDAGAYTLHSRVRAQYEPI